MASPVRFEMKGLRQLGANFKELSDVMQKKIAASATGAAATFVKNVAKQNITSSPAVQTGSLLGSIVTKKLRQSESGLTSAHIVTPLRGRRSKHKAKGKQRLAPHAVFVEYGTINMPAEPYLRPALERNLGRVQDIMKDKLYVGINAAVRKLRK